MLTKIPMFQLFAATFIYNGNLVKCSMTFAQLKMVLSFVSISLL